MQYKLAKNTVFNPLSLDRSYCLPKRKTQ